MERVAESGLINLLTVVLMDGKMVHMNYIGTIEVNKVAN